MKGKLSDISNSDKTINSTSYSRHSCHEIHCIVVCTVEKTQRRVRMCSHHNIFMRIADAETDTAALLKSVQHSIEYSNNCVYKRLNLYNSSTKHEVVDFIFKTIYRFNVTNVLWQVVPQHTTMMCKSFTPYTFMAKQNNQYLELEETLNLYWRE